MLEAGWSTRRVAHQLGRSDCVVRRCWEQWIREMSFTRRPGSESPRQTSRRKDRHIKFVGMRPTIPESFIVKFLWGMVGRMPTKVSELGKLTPKER
ncbi:uncharacterized protein TNCV_3260541 [Trichonephila clavipes]|nr:uncharacterized protein TNCV_3260541 [Trichonephila clavipes]